MNDLTNKTFGRWTVIEFDKDRSTSKKKYWKCQCGCELKTIRSVVDYNLKDGRSQSCGCYNKEQLIKASKGRVSVNTYDLIGSYGIGYTEKGDEFLFDLEDYELIKNYKWNINKSRTNCVQANVNHTTIKMHRLVLNVKSGEIIDHINRDETDNRKENLRLCSHSENMRNRHINSTNTTGHKGVHESKGRNRYEAYVENQFGKRVRKVFYFSTYDGKENAYNCACEWCETMDKQFSKEFSIYG